MPYFFDTAGTIPEGLGFSHYSLSHWLWLLAFVVFCIASILLYRKADEKKRKIIRIGFAALLWLDEFWKMYGLIAHGNYLFDYLPLHLCIINIFLITYHAFRPSRLLGNYLYTVGIPGAMAALLFPSWASLPAANFMYLHSFTVHILLAAYPIMLTGGREIRPDYRLLPKCMGLLLLMAIPVYLLNLLLGTNFMFLMEAEPGNPLYLFETMWGSHLLGFPVIIAGVLLVMHLPPYLMKKRG